MKNHLFKHIGSQLKLRSFFVSFFAFCLFNCSLSFAQSVPPLINYQGRLTDANGVGLTGTKRLEFNVYDAATYGNIVWGIRIIDDVPLVDGHFNVILSTDNQGRSIADAFNSKNRYIAIKVGEPHTDLSSVPEISPRQQILSAPYAVQAERAVHGVPAGTIIAFGGPSAPPGWLHCLGHPLSSQDYPELFAAIGTSWGNGSSDSDPRTDFNLPDLVGRFLRGRDHEWNRDPDWSSRTASKTGGNAGDAVGSVQDDATRRPNTAFKTDTQGNHHHSITSKGRWGDNWCGEQGWSQADGEKWDGAKNTSDAGAHSHTITEGGDSETRPKNAYVNWFIKY